MCGGERGITSAWVYTWTGGADRLLQLKHLGNSTQRCLGLLFWLLLSRVVVVVVTAV